MRTKLEHPPPEAIVALARSALQLHRRHVMSTFAAHRRIIELRDLAENVVDPTAKAAVVCWLIDEARSLAHWLDLETGQDLASELRQYLDHAAELNPAVSSSDDVTNLRLLLARWTELTPFHKWIIAERVRLLEPLAVAV